MNECINCNEPVKNKYCNVSCQNKHQGSLRANKKYGDFKEFEVRCLKCKKLFTVNEREYLHPQKNKYHCSRACANSRKHTDETKSKISVTLKGKNPLSLITLICKNCDSEFEVGFNRRHQNCCSRKCNMIRRNRVEGVGRKGGLASAKIQSETRRSKNEIHFAKLCENQFTKVLTNKPIFNGWDADVIIEDIKVAVLWNGVWHYKKITESHSVTQVQNRDKIKISEIKKAGYTPYIIKDMGKEDELFVKEKFKEFLDALGRNRIDSYGL